VQKSPGASLHRSQNNPRLGVLLAVSATLIWGVLGISLKLLLAEGIDGYTITWYRLTVSALVLLGVQGYRGRLPAVGALHRKHWELLAAALAGLVINYVTFVVALNYVSPATAQLVIQLAPILVLVGSLVVFGERFSGPQWIGVFVLIAGLLLFFNDRWPALLTLSSREAVGVALIVVGAAVWAVYALAQKQLLVALSSVNILLLLYIGAAVALLPMATPSQVFGLGSFGWALLAFGIFNTLAGYGCFAEALEHWEASRVSAVLTLTPVVTILAVLAILAVWPSANVGEPLDTLGWVGAALIVGGSMLAALWPPNGLSSIHERARRR
jgi:drug/metabolite transporter (DMT)-like permease